MSKIIFATTSSGRKNILSNIGIDNVEFFDNMVDENLIKQNLIDNDTNINNFSKIISFEKTVKLSNIYKDDYIVGFDQTLIFENKLLSKPISLDDLKQRLYDFSDKKHILQSSICITKNSKIIMEETDIANMYVRKLSDEFIDNYIENFGNKFIKSVGGYHYESEGIQLFKKVDGNYHTIIGMPIFGLLEFLRKKEKLL